MADLSTVLKPLVSAGRAYFAPYVSDTFGRHERYLGNSQNLAINVASESVQLFSAENGLDALDDETLISITRAGSLTLANISLDNLALFYVGDISAVAQSGASVTDEAHDGVQTDRWYQLGVSSSRPQGVQGIESVVVTNDTGSTTYDVTDDYLVDADSGRIYIVPTGDISDDDDILVDYDKVASAWDVIDTSSLKQNVGEFRFIQNNAKGANKNYYAPKCVLIPNGDAVLKSVGNVVYATLGFTLGFSNGPNGEAPLYIDGRPVASS